MQVINDALVAFRDDVASRGFPGAAFSPYKISQARPKRFVNQSAAQVVLPPWCG